MKVSGKGISGSRPVVPQKRDSMADGRDDDRETTPTPAGGRGKAEGRVRKKRRVVKSETKMNDKGYIGKSILFQKFAFTRLAYLNRFVLRSHRGCIGRGIILFRRRNTSTTYSEENSESSTQVDQVLLNHLDERGGTAETQGSRSEDLRGCQAEEKGSADTGRLFQEGLAWRS